MILILILYIFPTHWPQYMFRKRAPAKHQQMRPLRCDRRAKGRHDLRAKLPTSHTFSIDVFIVRQMTAFPLMSRCPTCIKFQQPCLHAEPCNFWMRPTPSQSAGLCFSHPLARWPHSVAWYKNYWIRRMNMIGCPLASVQVVQLLHAEH